MSHAAARRAIEAQVAAGWTGTPVAYDNVPFDPPANSSWARLTILNTGGNGVAIGQPMRYRFIGIVVFAIFAPEGKSATAITALVDTAIAMFEASAPGAGLVYTAVYPNEQGNDPDGPWFRIDINAEYRFDAIR